MSSKQKLWGVRARWALGIFGHHEYFATIREFAQIREVTITNYIFKCERDTDAFITPHTQLSP